LQQWNCAFFDVSLINAMDFHSVLNPPLSTADFPGIGGRIKSAPEDFEVEELPAYEPCGSGEFLFLFIEKRDMGAEFFARQVAHRLGIAVGEVGAAGLKDRHAVTRQWISVPASAEPSLTRLDGDGIRVLHTGRHSNKLRPGHLRGNRFRVVIRDVNANVNVPATVGAVLQRIREHGLPNYYGAQRFGRDGETLRLGLTVFSPLPSGESGRGEGSRSPRRHFRNPFLRKLALSAVQSALFNQYLGQRLSADLLRRVLHGDVMAKWPQGGMFSAEDVGTEQARFERREIVTAGPIFGRKTFPAKHEAAEREMAILAENGLSRESFSPFGKLLQGSRRHNLVYVDDLTAVAQLATVQLTFVLPAGSYATVLLRELMKSPLPCDEAAAID
jgi:tRNA pseudouridine13 synthase